MAFGSYQFDARDARVVTTLGKRARLWGVIALVTAIIGSAACAAGTWLVYRHQQVVFEWIRPHYVAFALAAMVQIIVTQLVTGAIYLSAGGRLVAVTRGPQHDLGQLMAGCQRLTRAFKVEVVSTVIGIAFSLAIASMFYFWLSEVFAR